MPTPLKQHKEFEERHYQEDNAPKFQEFQEIDHRNAKLKELMIFCSYCIIWNFDCRHFIHFCWS